MVVTDCCPISRGDGHDGPRPVGELIPGIGGQGEDVVVGLEDAVREPVLPHVLPDVLSRVEFRRPGRQGHQGNVVRDLERFGGVPAGLIENQDGVGAGGDLVAISSRWSCMAAVLQWGRTKPAPVPRAGQMAPKT